jgi:hypothetical protein
MPHTYKVQAHTVHLCAPCEFHKRTAALYTRLPDCGGYVQYACMHPKAFDAGVPCADPEKEAAKQRIIGRLMEHGRDIGKTEEQPDWCPLRNK